MLPAFNSFLGFSPSSGPHFLGLLVVGSAEWRLAETRVSERRRETKFEHIGGEAEEEIDHDGVRE